jgi:hypothetical protein
MERLKVWVLSSNPSTAKIKKQMNGYIKLEVISCPRV